MAKSAVVDERAEIREGIAELTKFYQKYQTKAAWFGEFLADINALRARVVFLLNKEDALEKNTKAAELNLSQVEREAQNRLQNVEQGHRAIIDRLSQKERELDQAKSAVEKAEQTCANLRVELELKSEALDRKLKGLTK
jgi:SpoU rRNA methylase family enzyme